MFYAINFHQLRENFHRFNDHFLSFFANFASGKNINSQSKRNSQKIQFYEFWLSFFRFFNFIDEQSCCITPDVYCCNFHVYISFGLWKNRKFFSAFLKSFQLSAEILKATTEQVGMCSIFSLVRELAK